MNSRGESRAWHESYRTRLLITDTVVLVWVVYGTQIVWFGTGNAQLALLRDLRFTAVSYWIGSAVLIILWLLALSLADTRTTGVVGIGMTEYVRVIDASLLLFGIIAIVAFLFRIDVARGYLLISLPTGILLLLLMRWLWRQWLIAKRRAGQCASGVILVGSPVSIAQLGRELQRRSDTGYVVAGACLATDAASTAPTDAPRTSPTDVTDAPAAAPTGEIAGPGLSPTGPGTVADTGIRILGTLDDLERILAATGADTVLVTSSDALPPERVKQISWRLEAGRQHLLLTPGIADVAGPRIHTRPVSGLPLVHVETPRFSPGQRFGKRMTDLTVALAAIVILSPLLAALAIAVRRSGPGPVCTRQTRIGHHGREFTLLAFRTTADGIEGIEAPAAPEGIHGPAGPADPADPAGTACPDGTADPADPADPDGTAGPEVRPTRLGRWMRRHRLDELPELFTVIGGSMSLVGPRPPRPADLGQFTDQLRRRFLVKPGITGLSQLSGGAALSREDAVRLDLSYVENWSLVGDLAILVKSAKAALLSGRTRR